MSEQPFGARHDRLGSAIDQTVRHLVRRDAPAGLRARVLGRLSAEPASVAWAWTPRRLALAGTVAVIAGVAALSIPRWLEQTAAPHLGSQTAANVPAHPALPPVRQPEPQPRIARPAEAMPQRAVQRREPRVEAVAATARAEGLLVIDPLPVPEPITIEPLESARMAPLRLVIAPLQFETVQIEPLRVSR